MRIALGGIGFAPEMIAPAIMPHILFVIASQSAARTRLMMSFREAIQIRVAKTGLLRRFASRNDKTTQGRPAT